MFSWPNKWEHASFGRNKTSIELQRLLDIISLQYQTLHALGKTEEPPGKCMRLSLLCRNNFHLNCVFSETEPALL